MQRPLVDEEERLLVHLRQHKGGSLSGSVTVPIDLYLSQNRTSKVSSKFNVTDARQRDGPSAAISLFVEHDAQGEVLSCYLKIAAQLLCHDRTNGALLPKAITIPLSHGAFATHTKMDPFLSPPLMWSRLGAAIPLGDLESELTTLCHIVLGSREGLHWCAGRTAVSDCAGPA
eukprot:COSAG02_NODE_2329_length_9121_cov_3.015183_12_plen_173_part_00